MKEKNEEVATENAELKKKVSDLGRGFAIERVTHYNQVGVINVKVQQLGKEKNAVKWMLDNILDDLRHEKERSSNMISYLKDEVAALKSGAVLIDESYAIACKKLFESP